MNSFEKHRWLEEHKEEVIDHVRNYGRWETLDWLERTAGIKDYLTLHKLLLKETGDAYFGLTASLRHQGQNLGDQLIDAMLRKVAQVEGEKVNLVREIDRLRRTLEFRGRHEKEKIVALEMAFE